jgi:hypothetical protein
MVKKTTSKKPVKNVQTVEEKIQELASDKEPETVSTPQVMQVVEVTDEKQETVVSPEPVVPMEKEEEIVVEEKVEEPVEESVPMSQVKQQETVSEFFSPSKETSSLGYPNISVHKKSIAPIIFWAIGVCLLVAAIGVGIISFSKGSLPISFARPTPTPSPVPTPIVTPTPEIDKKELEIEVLNGSGKAGVAGILKTLLEEKGYTVAGTGNAPNYDYAQTEIQVIADKEAFLSILQADLAGSYVIGSTSATLKSSLPYNAVIIIGKE